MRLEDLMVDSKSAWVSFPGLSGFEVEVVNLSRKELSGLRKRCTTQKFDKKTRAMIETLDEDKFVTEFSGAVINNWKGLTLEHLQSLMLVDTGKKELSTEVPYSAENAEILVNNSTEFDNWLNEVVFDLENFRSRAERTSNKTSGKAASES